MRIHWSVVVLALTAIIAVTWHLRTRHMNFLSTNGLRTTALATDHTPGIPDTLENQDHPTNEEITNQSPFIITEAHLGDLEASPALDSYRDFATNHSAEETLQLIDKLKELENPKRALLAAERIFDHSQDVSAETLEKASAQISLLKKEAVPWNFDQSLEVPLTLHLSSAREFTTNFKEAVAKVAKLAEKSSGQQIAITPILKANTIATTSQTPPIALWFSGDAAKKLNSPVVTFRLTEESLDTIADHLAKAIAQTVTSHLARKLPSEPDSGKILLTNHLTRLMWREFGATLTLDQSDSSE